MMDVGSVRPALLMRMSTLGTAVATLLQNSDAAVSLDRSPGMNIDWLENWRSSERRHFARSSSRLEFPTTRYFFFASATAMDRPIPAEQPVTTATFSGIGQPLKPGGHI